MPTYEVIEQGFFKGQMYDPNGKRRVLQTDTPLKPVPKWLKAVKDVTETAAEKKRRLADEAALAEVNAQNKRDIDAVTFQNPPSLSNAVETL